jgi:hypothetical protein
MLMTNASSLMGTMYLVSRMRPALAHHGETVKMNNEAYLPSPAPTEPSAAPKPLVAELEHLSTAFVHVLNERDFDFTSEVARELKSRLAHDFKAQLDTFAADSRPITFDEQVARWRQRAQENPGVKFIVLDVQTRVDNKKGRVNIFVEMEVDGISNVKLQALNVIKWKVVDAAWMCYKVIGMRGSSISSELVPG